MATLKTKTLKNRIVKASESIHNEIDFAEAMYNIWVKYNLDDAQTNLVQTASELGPDVIANTKGACLVES